MNDIHPMALFRYSVLGPLISRADLPRGELKATLRELAACHYDIPGSRRISAGYRLVAPDTPRSVRPNGGRLRPEICARAPVPSVAMQNFKRHGDGDGDGDGKRIARGL